jgi:hypothetical protein
MAVTTREELKSYCLRRLGAPTIKIDVTDQQAEDRIDDAIALFHEYHFDGVDHIYYKYQITDTDKINKYITMPANILGAIRVFPIQGSAGRVGDIFDVQYQIAMNDLYNLTNVSIVPYVITMTHLETLNQLLVGEIPVRYNKIGQRFYIDTNWNRFATGAWLLIEAYQVVDPVQYPTMWKDRWLQAYTTALIKQQWGANLSKFSGVQLPGGITLNGPLIYQQASDEVARLTEELHENYQMPIVGMFG